MIHFLMASITNLFGFEQIESDSGLDPTLIFKLINKDREEYLLVPIHQVPKSINTDSTDSVFDFLETLTTACKRILTSQQERTLTKNNLSGF